MIVACGRTMALPRGTDRGRAVPGRAMLTLVLLAPVAPCHKAEDNRIGKRLARISLAGAVSCSITHALVVPLDVCKMSMQLRDDLPTLRAAAGAVWGQAAGRGPARCLAFFNGIGATAAGYWLQGAAKFGAPGSDAHRQRRHITTPPFPPPRLRRLRGTQACRRRAGRAAAAPPARRRCWRGARGDRLPLPAGGD